MKYKKGDQTYKIGGLRETKVRLVVNGEDGESPWVGDAEDHYVLLNHAVNFMPLHSWGAILPKQAEIDVAKMRGETPDDADLTLHPEAWDQYLQNGVIAEDGTYLGESDDGEAEVS